MIGDVIEICGVKATHVEGGYNGEGEYDVGLDGFQYLANPFFDDPCNNKNALRPGISIGTGRHIGVLFFNGIPISDGDGNKEG